MGTRPDDWVIWTRFEEEGSSRGGGLLDGTLEAGMLPKLHRRRWCIRPKRDAAISFVKKSAIAGGSDGNGTKPDGGVKRPHQRGDRCN
jgi:hypothetical protein